MIELTAGGPGKGGKGRKGDRGNEIEAELTERETPTPYDECQSEEETETGANADVEKGEVFRKERDDVVLAKIAQVREIQAQLEHSEKWMWAFKQQGKYQPFRRPKRTLEQYVTPVVDACTIGYILQDTLQGKTVADLGAGTGCLGIVCLLAGAKKVNFYEIDPDAFKILEENCKVIIDKLEPTLDRNDEADGSEDDESAEEEAEETLNNVDNQSKQVKESSFLPTIETSKYKLVNCDVLKPKEPYTEVDLVIMNPPFGTSKDEGIDLEFIKTACSMTKGSIFIVHKLARTKVGYFGKARLLASMLAPSTDLKESFGSFSWNFLV